MAPDFGAEDTYRMAQDLRPRRTAPKREALAASARVRPHVCREYLATHGLHSGFSKAGEICVTFERGNNGSIVDDSLS